MRPFVLLAGFVFSGCAAVLASETTRFSVSGADGELLVNGVAEGRAPGSVELNNRNDHVLTIRGDRDQSCRVTRRVGVGWIVLDVLFGVIPVVVDAATGAWYRLEPMQCPFAIAEVRDQKKKAQPQAHADSAPVPDAATRPAICDENCADQPPGRSRRMCQFRQQEICGGSQQ